MDEESLIRGKTIDNIQKQSAKWKRATCQLIAEIQEMSNEENIVRNSSVENNVILFNSYFLLAI